MYRRTPASAWLASFFRWASLAALLALIFAFLLVIRGEIPQTVGIRNETLRVHQDSCACPEVQVSNFPTGFNILNAVEVSNFPAHMNVSVVNGPFPVSIVDTTVNLTGDVIFPSAFEATIAGGQVNCTVDSFPPVEVSNFPSSFAVSGGDVNCTVDNFPSSVSVDNFGPIQAVTPGGAVVNITSTNTGSLQVNLREPASAYGSLLTENLWPIFQTTAVYGINPAKTSLHTFGTGSVSASNSAFVVSSGSTVGSFATMQSRKRLFYRSGQGVRTIFSALFPEINSTLITRVVGLGTPEDGVFFAQVSGVFGILHANRGRREIRTLTVTTGSSTTESVTVTLNGMAYMVPVTNSGNIQRTVWELSQFVYAGWRSEARGATVIYISDQAQPHAGVYSLAATTAVGSFAQTRAGLVSTQTFVPSNMWNGDRMDGTGTSGVVWDITKFNVYAISMGYLGATPIRFMTQVVSPGASDSYFVTVHTLNIPNSLVTTSFGNPSFPFAVAVRTFTSESGSVQIGSFSGFVEGNIKYHGNRFTFQRSLSTTVTSGAYYPFFTIHNSHVRNGAANQGVVTVVGVSGSVNNAQPATIYFFRSTDSQMHQLGGNPNFAPYASNTGILYDTSASSFTPTGMEQLIWAQELSQVGSSQRYFLNAQNFESITLEPGEFISVCGRTNTGTAAYMSASLEVREDE